MNINSGKAVSTLALLALLLLPSIIAGSYEENIEEGIFLVRPDNEYITNTTVPTYLQDEDLTFFACIEDDGVPLRLSLLCEDTNEFADIPAYKWGNENCYLGSINLEQFDCRNAYARAEYLEGEENRVLEQKIRINVFSQTLNRIVETQFTDGGWQGALDTAYGLFVISNFQDLFDSRIAQAIEYLKLNRDNEDKCWPQEDCQVSTTANILFLLEKAGFEDLRIQNDGKLYLEREQNYIESSTSWTLNITDHSLNVNNSGNTTCLYDYKSSSETITLPAYPDTYEKNITPGYDTSMSLICTDPVFVDIYNQYTEQIVSYQGERFSYTIPNACWTTNNERISCDTRATLYALGIGIDEKQTSAGQDYLADLLVYDRTAGKHLQNDWTVIGDSLYTQVGDTDVDDVVGALLYQQNNNGSWNENRTYYPYANFEATDEEREEQPERLNDSVTRTIMQTGYAVMALLENGYDQDSEPVLDAQRYISVMESETGLNVSDEDLTDDDVAEAYEKNTTSILEDPKRNAMAFYVLKNNARPILRTEPQILVLNTENTTLDIINPTIFELDELQYELSDSLKSKIQIEEKDYVGGYSFRRIDITVLDDSNEDFGYLRLSINSNEYLKLPVLIDQQPQLQVSLPQRLTVFGASTTLPFEVSRSNHTFACGLEWESEGISSSAPFNVNNARNGSYNYPVRFSAVETENTIYNGTITCEANGVTFVTPFATNVVRFSSKPLEVQPPTISITDTDNYQVKLTNLLDRDIDVTASLREPDPYAVISDTYLSLLPGESRNITIQYVPQEENYSSTNSLILSTFDIEERVTIDVLLEPEESRTLGIIGWAIIAAIVIALAAAGLFAYLKREQLKEWYTQRFKKEDVREKIQQQVHEIEAEEQKEAIRNMMRISKLQGKKDSEIRDQLVAQGYAQEEIDAAVSSQNAPQEKKDDADKK